MVRHEQDGVALAVSMGSGATEVGIAKLVLNWLSCLSSQMGSGALKCLCSEEQEEIQEVDENKGE